MLQKQKSSPELKKFMRQIPPGTFTPAQRQIVRLAAAEALRVPLTRSFSAHAVRQFIAGSPATGPAPAGRPAQGWVHRGRHKYVILKLATDRFTPEQARALSKLDQARSEGRVTLALVQKLVDAWLPAKKIVTSKAAKAKANQATSTGGAVPQLSQNSGKAGPIDTDREIARIAAKSTRPTKATAKPAATKPTRPTKSKTVVVKAPPRSLTETEQHRLALDRLEARGITQHSPRFKREYKLERLRIAAGK